MNLKSSLLSSIAIASLSLLHANDTTTLDEVTVVSASGFEQNITDAPASISVITAEEIKKKSYSDVADVLKHVPGVFVSGGGGAQSIIMRGMQKEYTLFLIDGKPIQTINVAADANGTRMNNMPPVEVIEKIEVIRGPASSLYGSNAMGGVINIITKKNVNEATGGISFEYLYADPSNKVNNDGMNTSVYLNVPLVDNLLSVALDGVFNYTQESDYQTDSSSITGSDPEYKNKNLGVNFTLTPDDKNTFTLGGRYTKQERNYTVGKSLLPTDSRGRSASDESKVTTKRNFNTTHEYKLDDFSLNSYITYDNESYPKRFQKADTLIANTQATYSFDSNILVVGLNYKEESLEDLEDFITRDSYQYSFFIEDEWFITDDLSVSLGGRYDDHEFFGGHVSPKAYAVYRLNENFTLKGGVTTGYKTARLEENAPVIASTSSDRADTLGNPNVKPEKSINYEIALAYDNDDIGLHNTITFYQTDFKDRITTTANLVCAPNQPCNRHGNSYAPSAFGYVEYTNIDEAELRGVELTTDYDINDNLTYRHSYTYTYSEQKSGSQQGLPLEDVPKHMFNVSLDWQASSKLDLWSQVNYRSKTITSGAWRYKDGPDPAYATADIGGAYKFSKKLTLKAGIYNLLNEEQNRDNSSLVLDGRRYSFAIDYKF